MVGVGCSPVIARRVNLRTADYQLLVTSVSAVSAPGDWAPEVALNNHRWWRLAAPGAAATGALCAGPGTTLLCFGQRKVKTSHELDEQSFKDI